MKDSRAARCGQITLFVKQAEQAPDLYGAVDRDGEKRQQEQRVGGDHRMEGDGAGAIGYGDGFFHAAEARRKKQRNR